MHSTHSRAVPGIEVGDQADGAAGMCITLDIRMHEIRSRLYAESSSFLKAGPLN